MVMHALIRRVLGGIGLNPDRFSLQWASAAEAPRFVRLITEFTAQVRELGPLGSSEGLEGEELRQRLDKALQFVSDRKLRVAFGNLTRNLRKDGGYYWVYATVIPNVRNDEIVGYTSVRRKPSRKKVEECIALYPTLF